MGFDVGTAPVGGLSFRMAEDDAPASRVGQRAMLLLLPSGIREMIYRRLVDDWTWGGKPREFPLVPIGEDSQRRTRWALLYVCWQTLRELGRIRARHGMTVLYYDHQPMAMASSNGVFTYRFGDAAFTHRFSEELRVFDARVYLEAVDAGELERVGRPVMQALERLLGRFTGVADVRVTVALPSAAWSELVGSLGLEGAYVEHGMCGTTSLVVVHWVRDGVHGTDPRRCDYHGSSSRPAASWWSSGSLPGLGGAKDLWNDESMPVREGW